MKETINIKFPKKLANSLRLKEKDFVNEIKAVSLIKLYELGKVSSGVAASVIGISRIDFLDLLNRYNVSIFSHYDINEIHEDIKNA